MAFDHIVDLAIERLRVRHVEHRDGTFDLQRDGCRPLLVDVTHDHTGVVTREPPGVRGAQSGSAASDHHHLGSQ